jgi:hypothetical protein
MDEVAAALDKIATALTRLAAVESKRFHKEYPKQKPKRAAEITRDTDDKDKQFNDRPTAEWVEETEQVASRFRKAFDEGSKIGSTPAKTGGSPANEHHPGASQPVSSADANLRNNSERKDGD